MKVTHQEIQNALKNTFDVSNDEGREKYSSIRSCEDEAIIEIGKQVEKTQNHFLDKDWKKVYQTIKAMLA